ncbi:hypothetical protein [Streptomyces sp. MK37H]|uniref:hypothetical protein n=1 Tax=Streptomyces sp. MK37H TaxID=2699117 RepID=UPI001B39533B|nr:hypothetical protein [Streptomyces sp. MK37H]
MTAIHTARWFDRYREPPETGVAPGRIAEIVLEETRGLRPLPAYPVALQPLLLPVAEFRELLRAATDLLALIRRAVLHAAPDRAGRIAALGIGPADTPLFTADEDFELRHCADMGRADVVIGPDGPRFVEFNVSGAFGGMPDCHAHQQAWRRITALAGRPAYLGVDPWAHLAALVERTCAEFGAPPGIVVVDDVGDGTVLATGRSVRMWLDGLRTHGIEARHVQVADLLDTLGHPGTLRYPVGLRGFDLDDMRTVGHDIRPARRALDAGFRMIPSQTSRLLHTKKVFARLSEGAPWMGAADHDPAPRAARPVRRARGHRRGHRVPARRRCLRRRSGRLRARRRHHRRLTPVGRAAHAAEPCPWPRPSRQVTSMGHLSPTTPTPGASALARQRAGFYWSRWSPRICHGSAHEPARTRPRRPWTSRLAETG